MGKNKYKNKAQLRLSWVGVCVRHCHFHDILTTSIDLHVEHYRHLNLHHCYCFMFPLVREALISLCHKLGALEIHYCSCEMY